MVKKLKSRLQKIEKLLKTKVTNKATVKTKKVTVKIPEYKAPSILNDPNRFFKDEYEETKKALFFK